MSPPGPFPVLADRPGFDPPWFPADAGDTLLLSEVIGALSYALDLTEGQPPGHCLRCCWLGMHIGKTLGLDEAALRDLYYTILLKDAGCSSNAARLCELYGVDERRVKHDFKLVDTNSMRQLTSFVLSHAGLQDTGLERFRRILHLAASGENLAAELVQTRCERGSDIARELGFNDKVAAAIYNLDEHWDGRGKPHGRHGDAIPLGARIALLAQVADVFFTAGGKTAALHEVCARRGTWFDPDVVAAFESVAGVPELWQGLSHPGIERLVRELEPGSAALPLDEARLDAVASAFARVVDAKSPFTAGHSSRVAEYAEAIAKHLLLSVEECNWIRRAALLHDLGKLAVSNDILDKPGSLAADEWDQIKAHPRHTREILERIGPFQRLAIVAGAHHERLDGAGYPDGLRAADIPLSTRIITVADIFDALSAERPYRAAIPVAEALSMMEKIRGKAIDAQCLDALKVVVSGINPGT
jgi:HD-GYP domain-containing protein (c-di-GMP phosphodiesterase class II)